MALGLWPDGWRSASYSDEMVPEAIRKTATPGQVYKNPQTGHALQKQASGRWKLVDSSPPPTQPSRPEDNIDKKAKLSQAVTKAIDKNPEAFAKAAAKEANNPHQKPPGLPGWQLGPLPGKDPEPPDTSKMKKLAEGNYGIVYEDPATGHVVKTLKEGKEWGPYEAELGKKMGELGHSPKVYSSSPSHIEMDFSKGKPLWTGGFVRTDDEKERGVKMSSEQAQKSLDAIRDLHKMGFYHGDLHNEQFLTDGEGGKESTLIDYGLSGKIQDQPHKAIVDFNKVGKLIDIYRTEFDNDPYVQLVRSSVDAYKEAKGQSKAAVAKRSEIGKEYLAQLQKLG